MRRRRMMERMENLLDSFTVNDSGYGLLLLVRVVYRERSKMDGIGKYRERAELARKVCALFDGEAAVFTLSSPSKLGESQ